MKQNNFEGAGQEHCPAIFDTFLRKSHPLVVLIDYVDDRFGTKAYKDQQRRRLKELRTNPCGVHYCLPWTFEDLSKTTFFQANTGFLSRPVSYAKKSSACAFKGYIILDALRRLSPGDIVLYYDASPDCVISKDVSRLTPVCLKNGGVLPVEHFTLHRHFCNHTLNAQFHQFSRLQFVYTKAETFRALDCSPQSHGAHTQTNFTWQMYSVNRASEAFILDILRHNLDDRISQYGGSATGDHRGMLMNLADQSIMDLMVLKYEFKALSPNWIKWLRHASLFGRGSFSQRQMDDVIHLLDAGYLELKNIDSRRMNLLTRAWIVSVIELGRTLGLVPRSCHHHSKLGWKSLTRLHRAFVCTAILASAFIGASIVRL